MSGLETDDIEFGFENKPPSITIGLINGVGV